MSRVILPDYDYYSLVNRDHELAQGLVSWWRVMPGWFGGTTWRDLMQRNDATLTGMALPATSTSGAVVGTSRQGGDGEVRFDGSNDYGFIPSTETKAFPGEMSGVVWIRSAVLSGFRFVVGQTSPGTEGQFAVLTGITANAFTLNWADGHRATSTASLVSDRWVQLGWVRSGGTGNWTAKLFLNGQLDTTVSGITVNPPSTIRNFYIGSRGGSSSHNGAIDDILLYTSTISDGGMAALYQSSLLWHPDLLRHITHTYYSIPSSPPASTRVKIIGGGLLLGAA